MTRIAQKVGEEGVELALAAVTQDDEAMIGEAADLVYHTALLLKAKGLSLAQVAAELESRHAERGDSGLVGMRTAAHHALRLHCPIFGSTSVSAQRVNRNPHPHNIERHRRPRIVIGAINDESGGPYDIHRLIDP